MMLYQTGGVGGGGDKVDVWGVQPLPTCVIVHRTRERSLARGELNLTLLHAVSRSTGHAQHAPARAPKRTEPTRMPHPHPSSPNAKAPRSCERTEPTRIRIPHLPTPKHRDHARTTWRTHGRIIQQRRSAPQSARRRLKSGRRSAPACTGAVDEPATLAATTRAALGRETEGRETEGEDANGNAAKSKTQSKRREPHRKKAKHTAPGLPMWSPTIVLPRPEPA